MHFLPGQRLELCLLAEPLCFAIECTIDTVLRLRFILEVAAGSAVCPLRLRPSYRSGVEDRPSQQVVK